MKIYFIALTILLFLVSCAHKNAFDSFNITKKQENSEEQLQNSKIKGDDGTVGFATVVYLNNIYKNSLNNNEMFYVSFYTQNSVEPIFFLNSEKAISVKKLSNHNKYTNLTSLDNSWLKYYLVSFKNSNSNRLRFQIKNDNSSSRELLFYKKD